MAEIKDYKFLIINEKEIDKDKYTLSEGFKEVPERAELNTRMKEILSDKGIVYFISKNNEVSGIVLIGCDKAEASEYGLEEVIRKQKGKKPDDNDLTVNVFDVKETYLSDDLKEQKDDLTKYIVENVKKHIDDYTLEVRVIKCGDFVTVDRTAEGAGMIIICFIIGMIIGGALGNFIPMLSYGSGAVLGMVIGGLAGYVIRSNVSTWK